MANTWARDAGVQHHGQAAGARRTRAGTLDPREVSPEKEGDWVLARRHRSDQRMSAQAVTDLPGDFGGEEQNEE